MRSFTHYLVDALLSLSTRASQRRAHHPNRRPALLNLLLLACVFCMAGTALAQPFTAVTGLTNPLNSIDVGTYSAPVVVDINGDGKLDLFVGGNDGAVYYFENTTVVPSSPSFAPQPSTLNPLNLVAVGSNAKPAFVDINDDGAIDCFVGAADGTVHFYRNVGTATSPSFQEETGPYDPGTGEGNPLDGEDVTTNAAPTFADVDGDTDIDCFIGRGSSTASVRYFRNDGTIDEPFFLEYDYPDAGIFTSLSPNLSNATPTFVDFNYDGNVDFFAGTANGTFSFFQGAANGIFPVTASSNPLSIPSAKDVGNYSAPAFLDLDGDTDLDCISGNSTGTINFYRNGSCVDVPVITACPNVTVSLSGGTATVPTGVVANNASCVGSPTLTYSLSSISCSDYPSTTVTATATNTTNFRSTQCAYTVTIVDAVAPTNTYASAPLCSATPYTVNLDNFGAAYMGTIDPANVVKTFTDNSGCTPTYSIIAQPPAVFQFTCANIIGGPAYTLTLRATDGAGNSTTCTQNIQIRDNVAPVVPAQNLINFPTIPLTTCGSAAVSYTVPTPAAGTDNCSGTVTVTSVPAMPFAFPVGSTTVTWTYSDNATPANMVTRTQIVTVANSVNPSFTAVGAFCPASPILVNSSDDGTGDCSTIVSWTLPLAVDCDGDYVQMANALPTTGSLVGSHTSGSLFSVGTSTVVYFATDVAGHTGVCTFNVTVMDNELPIVTNPPALTGGFNHNVLSQQPSICGRVVTWDNPPALPANMTITDNCSQPLSYTLEVRKSPYAVGDIVNFVSGDVFPYGNYRLFYFVNDGNGNSVLLRQSAIINVNDNQFPSITCPTNQTLTTTVTGLCAADLFLANSFISTSDNCGSPVLSGPFSNSSFTTPLTLAPAANYFRIPVGSTTVYYYATDASSNSASCSFTVTVTDTQKPVLSGCTSSTVPVVLPTVATCEYLNYTIAAVSATDNCSLLAGQPVIRLNNSVIAGPTVNLPEGSNTLSFTATDVNGNSTACAYTVEVRNTQAPSFGNCPGGIGATMNVNVSPATTCGYTLAANSFTGVGQLNLTNGGVGCDPGTLSFEELTLTGAVPRALGYVLPIGTNVLRAKVTDFSGSTSTCQFQVVVQDLQVPYVFGACPSNQTVYTGVNAVSCSAVPNNYVAPDIRDNCGIASAPVTVTNNSVTSPYTQGGPLQKGTNVISYSATDIHGNPAIGLCNFTVTVIDNTLPAITCPNNMDAYLTDAPGCAATASYTAPVGTDNCTGQSTALLSGPASGASLALVSSPYTVIYRVTDASSNTKDCTFTITVKDNSGPVFNGGPCALGTVNINVPSGCSGPYTWSDPTSVSDCTASPTFTGPTASPATTITSPSAGMRTATFAVANNPTTVSYVATDALGNSRICSFQVVVNNSSAPAFVSCPSFVDIPADALVCSKTVTAALLNDPLYRPAAAPDACGANINVVLTASLVGGTPTPNTISGLPYVQSVGVGSGSRLRATWTATKGSLTATCTSQIRIIDDTDPILICPTYTVQVDIPGNNYISSTSLAFVPTSIMTVSDNCTSLSSSSVVVDAPSLPGQFYVGNSTVNWRVSDGNGNTSTCAQTITVTPNNSTPPLSCTPSFTCPPANPSVRLTSPANNCLYNITSDVPAVTVTCNGTTTVQPSTTGNKSAGTYAVTYTYNSNTICTVNIQVQNPATEIASNGIDDNCNGQVDENNPTTPSGDCYDNPVDIVTSTATSNQRFGVSVDVDGDYAVVGANQDNGNRGAVYILHKQGMSWVQVGPKIHLGSAATTSDYFGESVAISGNDIIVGARRKNGLRGAAYIFSKDQGGVNNWGLVATLTPSTLPSGAEFGGSVDIDGIHAIVGARRDKNGSVITGSVYIFMRNGLSSWSQQGGPRFAPGGLASDYFGCSVSISVPYAVVGAYGVGTNDQGRAYVLTQGINEAWTVGAAFFPPGLDATAHFGCSVATDGARFIVGANNQQNEFGDLTGGAYIYQITSATPFWSFIQGVEPDGGNSGELSGSTVAIFGDFAAVGSGNPITSNSQTSESVHVYMNDGYDDWSTQRTIAPGLSNDYFGIDVALDGGTLVVGAFRDDIGINTDQGSAYFYETCPLSSFAPQNNADSRNKETYPIAANGTVRCFPNPFSDVLNIELSMEQEENVTVTVCDASGREIAVVFNDKTNGISNLQWSSQGFADGMYFVRVTSPTIRKVMPVVVLRERP